MFMSSPGQMASAPVREARLASLESTPAIQPLRAYRDDLIARRERTRADGDDPVLVPHFDPAEAGVSARALLVLEAPGPMTNEAHPRGTGSGFISCDNDDRTARNLWEIRNEVGPSQALTVTWNIVPWFLGPSSVKPTKDEVRAGALELGRLMALLPDLAVVVACGTIAQDGISRWVKPYRDDLRFIDTWHPSGRALNQPGKRDELIRDFRRTTALIGDAS